VRFRETCRGRGGSRTSAGNPARVFRISRLKKIFANKIPYSNLTHAHKPTSTSRLYLAPKARCHGIVLFNLTRSQPSAFIMKNSRRHKTKQELAAELGMSRFTLYRWIHELGLHEYLSGRLLSPAEQDGLRSRLDNFEKSRASPSPPAKPAAALQQIDTD
jgi:hypothetical protein